MLDAAQESQVESIMDGAGCCQEGRDLGLPLYEYECSVCQHRFELLQKFSDEPASSCVRCGGPVARLISRSSIQFKGTGWYVTDYARKGVESSEAKGDGKSEPEGEKKPPASKEAGDNKNVAASPSQPAAKAGQ